MILAIFGLILIFIGFLLSLTIFGAVIGIPLMIVGAILCGLGRFRSRVVIKNVVNVTNTVPVAAAVPASEAYAPPEEAYQSRIGEAAPMPRIETRGQTRIEPKL